MKIVRLNAKNVKRLRAVEITPEGNLVVISGKNGQGKSSVLDSIAYALGGKELACPEPLRRGAEHGEVTCDLGEFVVKRTFTPDGGGALTVETKDGARFKSPQTRLDGLIGKLSFDPLEFARMDPKAQGETLRKLLGLDFAELDGLRGKTFDERTDVNREGKAMRARLDAMPAAHEGVPAAEVSSVTVLAELEAAQAQNTENAEKRRLVAEAERSIQTGMNLHGAAREQCERTRKEIAALQGRLKTEEAEVERLAGQLQQVADIKAERERVAAALVDQETESIKARLTELEDVNRKVRENGARAQLEADLATQRTMSQKLTDKIDAFDAQKRDALAKVSFPVDGLGVSDGGGVLFNGLPFEQASAAEQLRASVAIGLALNPKLRVLLIRDGSLLDQDSLRLVAEMADQHDAQLWVERVEDGGATVVIEDGAVVGQVVPEEAAS